MFAILSFRSAGVMGVAALALFTAGLATFPSFPTTRAGLFDQHSVTVNRALKGDRSPIRAALQPAPAGTLPVRDLPAPEIPFGCDRAFSPISSPELTNVFRRCMT